MSADTLDESKIIELQTWFQDCSLLPQCIDPLLLRRFVACMYGDIEEAKKLILLHYKLRNKCPELFIERDPTDNDSRRTFEYADIVPLPGLTPEGYKVSCFRICDFDPSKVHHREDTKAFFMLMDCRFTLNDLPEDKNVLATGEVQIFDMTGFTMKHLAKISFSTFRTYIRFLQDAFPVRLKAVHIINCPSYLDKIMAVLKPFISTQVYKMMQFHTNGLDRFYEQVPRSMLPEEYGGGAGKLAELKSSIMGSLIEKREYLMSPSYWRVEQAE